MAPEQEDRGVEDGEVETVSDGIVLHGQSEVDEEGHVLDGTGRPAKSEDHLATD